MHNPLNPLSIPFLFLFLFLISGASALCAQDSKTSDILGFWETTDEENMRIHIKKDVLITLVSIDPVLAMPRPLRHVENGLLLGGFASQHHAKATLIDNVLTIAFPEPVGQKTFRKLDQPDNRLSISPLTPDVVADQLVDKNSLKKELLDRLKKEQSIRQQFMKATGGQLNADALKRPEVVKIQKSMDEIDSSNKKYLIEHVGVHGWVQRKDVGDKAAQAAFMIALHSGHLPLMRTAAEALSNHKGKGGPNEQMYAVMADRVSLIMQMPMSYGIQAGMDAEGTMVIPVIKDRAELNANRKRIGQPPIEEYIEILKNSKRKVRIVEMEDDGFMAQQDGEPDAASRRQLP